MGVSYPIPALDSKIKYFDKQFLQRISGKTGIKS